MKKLILTSFVAVLLGMVATSCDKLVYDDLSECAQYVAVRYYMQTPCESTPQYDRLTAIRTAHLFVYDQAGKLVDHQVDAAANIQKEYQTKVKLPTPGTYQIVFWGMEAPEAYKISGEEDIKTLKVEAIQTLKAEGAKSFKGDLPLLVHGVPITYNLPERQNTGSVTDTLDMNSVRCNNDLIVKINGLDPTKTYSLVVEDTNRSYDAKGGIVGDRVHYQADLKKDGEVFSATLSLLKIRRGQNNPIIKIYDGDQRLVSSLHLIDLIDQVYLANGQPLFKFECQHEIDLEFTVDDTPEEDGTYMVVWVRIGPWKLMIRDIILS